MAEGLFGTSQLWSITKKKEAEFLQNTNMQSQHGHRAKNANIHIKWHALPISVTEHAEMLNALLIVTQNLPVED